MIKASCLCGAVHWEADALTTPIGNCYCRTCQKAHSAPYAPTARAKRDGFRWTKGAADVGHFESSPGKLRHFCRSCGSQLMAEWVDQDEVILRIGVVDEGLSGEEVAVNIWTSHMPDYDKTSAKALRFEEGVPTR